MDAYRVWEAATGPICIPPQVFECVPVPPAMSVMNYVPASVEVVASGEVGPSGFDVVGSGDPDALVVRLRDNSCQATGAMDPIIDLYGGETGVFPAVKLRPGQGIQDIEPVQVTYHSERPMFPLRLTAAHRHRAVIAWIYADRQAAPVYYAGINVANDEIVFFGRGGHNYRQLMSDRADECGGPAFITECSAPTRDLRIFHPLLGDLRDRYPYVARLNTVISPEETNVDPVFDYDAQLEDVMNNPAEGGR